MSEFLDDPSTGLMTVIFPDLPAQIEGDLDHEKINNLLGGNENGHYHLTAEEYDLIGSVLGSGGGEFHKLTDGEHERLIAVLNILSPDENSDTAEQIADLIEKHIARYMNEYEIIDGGDLT